MGFGVGLDPVGVVWGARDLDPGWFLDLGVVWGARDLDPDWFLDLFISSALFTSILLTFANSKLQVGAGAVEVGVQFSRIG